jgi:hypothetical protein
MFHAVPRELPRGVSLPDKDVPILLAAMEARAPHLIPGNIRHFGSYFEQTIEGIVVDAPAVCLKNRHAQ